MTEFSPIVIAAVVAGGVTTGAILLNSGVLLSEEVLNTSLSNASSQGIVVDEKTRLLLNVALALVGVGTLVLGESLLLTRPNSNTTAAIRVLTRSPMPCRLVHALPTEALLKAYNPQSNSVRSIDIADEMGQGEGSADKSVHATAQADGRSSSGSRRARCSCGRTP